MTECESVREGEGLIVREGVIERRGVWTDVVASEFDRSVVSR